MTNSFQAQVEYIKPEQHQRSDNYKKSNKFNSNITKGKLKKSATASQSKYQHSLRSTKENKLHKPKSQNKEFKQRVNSKLPQPNPLTQDKLLQPVVYVEPHSTISDSNNEKSNPIIPLEYFQISANAEYWNNPRFLACLCLKSVLEDKRSLNFSSIATYAGINKGFISELVYGVLRFLPQINFIVNKLQNKKIERSHYFAVFALQLAIYQLLYMQRAEHAVLYETVNLVKQMYNKGLANMVNGMLRNFLRQENELVAQSYKQKLIPGWLDKLLTARYSQQEYEQIVVHTIEHPPLWIRINLNVVTQADFIEALESRGIEFKEHEFLLGALLLPQAPAIELIPGYEHGWFVVQDLHAQYAAFILSNHVITNEQGYQLSNNFNHVSTNVEGKAQLAYNNHANVTILDACCAPGGKTTHLCSIFPQGFVLACEYEPARIPLVFRNIFRCNQVAYIINANACHLNKWIGSALKNIAGELGAPTLKHIEHYWQQNPQSAQQYLEQHQQHFLSNQEISRNLQLKVEQHTPIFDLILLDVPCSATGVIRRHQDIKWLRRADDIEPLATTQLNILRQAWQQLKVGGKLLYTTCSILGQENDAVIEKFLQETDNCEIVDLLSLRQQLSELNVLANSVTTGIQLLPHALQGDGFYYCLITKNS